MSFIPPEPVQSDVDVPMHADVVVIGGGIVGVATTLALSEAGVSVTLCEKGKVAAEQSCRNWGWTRQMGRDVAELPLIIKSLQAWAAMKGRVGQDVGFRRTGATYVCRTERQLAEYEAWLPLAREYGIPTKLLSSTELPGTLTGISKGFVGAMHTATDGVAEPHLATPAMAEAARRKGATLLTGCAVRFVESEAGRVSHVVTERGQIRCQSVVLAGGSWSRLFAGNIGIDVPQLKILGSAARVEPPPGNVPDMPVGGTKFSFRPRSDGGYTIARRNANIASITPDSFRLFGSFAPTLIKSWGEMRLRINKQFIEEWRIPKRWSPSKVTPFERVRILDPHPTTRLNQEAVQHLGTAFPAFRGSRISHQWAGLIDVTPDAVPIMGEVENCRGSIWPRDFLAMVSGWVQGQDSWFRSLSGACRRVLTPNRLALNVLKSKLYQTKVIAYFATP